jgi:hypothetical protein
VLAIARNRPEWTSQIGAGAAKSLPGRDGFWLFCAASGDVISRAVTALTKAVLSASRRVKVFIPHADKLDTKWYDHVGFQAYDELGSKPIICEEFA